jgi:hypothetical protein
MTAINFPDSPEIGDTFTPFNNRTWVYVGNGIWNTSETQVIMGPSGPQGEVGPTGPQGAVGPTGAAGLSITGPTGPTNRYLISATVPASPVLGDAWFNSSNGKTYIYYSNAWIEQINDGPQGFTGPTGPQGVNGTNGLNGTFIQASTTGPTAGAGNNGDLWIVYS